MADQDQRFRYYQAQIVPWLWLLTLTTNCRIFQGLNVPDIIDKVFKERNVGEFRFALQPGDYTARDYCVQYRETDFNFVSRLMEDEGIFYFFEHVPDAKSGRPKHVMVIADSLGQVQPCPHQKQARFSTSVPSKELIYTDTVTAWQKTNTLRPGRFALRDYNFQLNKLVDGVDKAGILNQGAHSDFEVYDYPGDYAEKFNLPNQRIGEIHQEGEKIVQVRMEEEETGEQVHNGTSSCRCFCSGFEFDLTGHPGGMDGPYVLTSVQHTATQAPAYVSGVGLTTPYQNSFTCVAKFIQSQQGQPAPLRPARVTPKPVIQGLQTALVAGPKDANGKDIQEIYTDDYGRVQLIFNWDRERRTDGPVPDDIRNQSSSCWVRVAQLWAGKRWGASFFPRVGQEVVVAFEEGDPDRPIIIGSVYNSGQMPPYIGGGPDPKHKNDNKVSGIKSNTTLGGEGYNELRFDDTKGKEQVFIHAQRNLEMTTNGDSLARTYGNRHEIIGGEKDGKKSGDQREMVYQDKHLKIHRNHIEQIGGRMQLLVGGIDSGQGDQDLVIHGTKKESIGEYDHLHITGDRKQKIDGAQSLTVGGSQQEKIGMKHAVDAGQEIHLKAGMTIVIEAGVQLTLKVGGNFVDISPAGVSIQGTMVMINSGGAAGSGSGSSPENPQDPTQASPTEPDVADDSKSGQKSSRS